MLYISTLRHSQTYGASSAYSGTAIGLAADASLTLAGRIGAKPLYLSVCNNFSPEAIMSIIFQYCCKRSTDNTCHTSRQHGYVVNNTSVIRPQSGRLLYLRITFLELYQCVACFHEHIVGQLDCCCIKLATMGWMNLNTKINTINFQYHSPWFQGDKAGLVCRAAGCIQVQVSGVLVALWEDGRAHTS